MRRVDLLRNFYEVGERAVARTSPYAFVVPRAQRDAGAARKMLELLSFGGVEIERAGDAFAAGGKRYAEGSYIIRMQQPYSSYAKTLLERQHYPDLRMYPGGPPQRPYDVTAQTLPLLMGVETDTIDTPFRVVSKAAKSFTFEGSAASDSDAWREANKIWSSGAHVWRDTATGEFFPRRPQQGEAVDLARPRIALYKSYVPAIDEGWTRWLLEDFGFAYQNVLNPDIDARQSAPAFRCNYFSRSTGVANRNRLRSRNHAAGVHRRIRFESRGELEDVRRAGRHAGVSEPIGKLCRGAPASGREKCSWRECPIAISIRPDRC